MLKRPSVSVWGLSVWGLCSLLASTVACSDPDRQVSLTGEPGDESTEATDTESLNAADGDSTESESQPTGDTDGAGNSEGIGDVQGIDESALGAADATTVTVSGGPGAYTFRVTVSSPDTGCDGYADFWEVVTADGELLYRRVLEHSHVDEQPFTRSGGPVSAGPDDEVIVRAHFSPGGYAGVALSGTPSGEFTEVDLEDDFASQLASEAPQPPACTS